MTREEMQAQMQELLQMANPENQARMTEILSGITDEYDGIVASRDAAESKVEELTANNETLREVNAKLFLKVGNAPSPSGPTEPTNEPSDEIPQIAFESLFNEKGMLK